MTQILRRTAAPLAVLAALALFAGPASAGRPGRTEVRTRVSRVKRTALVRRASRNVGRTVTSRRVAGRRVLRRIFESGGVAGPLGSPTPDQASKRGTRIKRIRRTVRRRIFESGGVAGPLGSPTPDQKGTTVGHTPIPESGGVAGPKGDPTPDQKGTTVGHTPIPESGGVAGPKGDPTPDQLGGATKYKSKRR